MNFGRVIMDQTKLPYQTLPECLLIVSQLGAPVAPFFMDRLCQDLTRNKKNSVHLSEFPNPTHL